MAPRRCDVDCAFPLGKKCTQPPSFGVDYQGTQLRNRTAADQLVLSTFKNRRDY
jgi:hypothetical protein